MRLTGLTLPILLGALLLQVVTAKMKPRKCPDNACKGSCNTDQDCKDGKKCCLDCCGYTCQHPVGDPGECRLPDNCKAPEAECRNDEACAKEGKICCEDCCDFVCRHRAE